jgi:hypothetical protein
MRRKLASLPSGGLCERGSFLKEKRERFGLGQLRPILASLERLSGAEYLLVSLRPAYFPRVRLIDALHRTVTSGGIEESICTCFL